MANSSAFNFGFRKGSTDYNFENRGWPIYGRMPMDAFSTNPPIRTVTPTEIVNPSIALPAPRTQDVFKSRTQLSLPAPSIQDVFKSRTQLALPAPEVLSLPAPDILALPAPRVIPRNLNKPVSQHIDYIVSPN